MEDRSARDAASGSMRIAGSALAVIRAQAARAAPEECCGLLVGRDGLIERALPAANVAPDRLRHFEIDPQALVDAHREARSGGPQLIGYFHSHPNGNAAPSAIDAAQASGDGRVWAIVAGQDVTFWRDGEGGFIPLSYVVEDR